jgi:hypothetical protein
MLHGLHEMNQLSGWAGKGPSPLDLSPKSKHSGINSPK